MLRALLVEDDPFFRRAVAHLLTIRFPGIVIEEAGDAEVALRKLAARRPDLAFVDIGLPNKNGFELTGEIKSMNVGVSVAVLSSHDTPEYREAALREGADWYICKTADTCRDQIIGCVASLSNQRQCLSV
jgi:DNA-binding NarL/FixJ family response regulator